MLSDEELILRTAAGELNAFNQIVLRHQETAWRPASRFLSDPVEAQDIAQEAFVRIFEAAP
jgi:RNA polymerase sigma-70 factor (ECF subfamily)